MIRSFVRTLGLALLMTTVASATPVMPTDGDVSNAAVRAADTEPIDFDRVLLRQSSLVPIDDDTLLGPVPEDPYQCNQGISCLLDSECGPGGICADPCPVGTCQCK